MMALSDIMGPKRNFFSPTVCTLDQYLKNGSCLYIRPIFKKWQRKVSFASIDSNAEVGPVLPIAICRENGHAMRELMDISRPT